MFLCFLVFDGVFCFLLCFLFYFWIPLVFLRRLHQFSSKNIDSGRFLGRFIFFSNLVVFEFYNVFLNFGVHQYFFLQQHGACLPGGGGSFRDLCLAAATSQHLRPLASGWVRFETAFGTVVSFLSVVWPLPQTADLRNLTHSPGENPVFARCPQEPSTHSSKAIHLKNNSFQNNK